MQQLRSQSFPPEQLPEHAEAPLERGRIYALQEQLESAISDFPKAIAVRPEVTEPYHHRRHSYERLSR